MPLLERNEIHSSALFRSKTTNTYSTNMLRLSRQLFSSKTCKWDAIMASSRSLRASTLCHQDDSHSISITRVYADENGHSKFGSFMMKMTGSGDIGYLSKLTEVTGIQFRYTPSSYHYSWHNAPNRQFIINLDADVEVEVAGGEKRIIKQGEVFFVEDTTGTGHYSRAVSSQPRHSVFILVNDNFKAIDQ